ncbi:MAG TPA: hypothetical protein VIO11_11430, partial [Candidatus Methanoperedens sp.]
VLEHGMVIGDTGHVSYIINPPLLSNNSMDVLLVNCDNTSTGSSVALNLQVYPVTFSSRSVDNASISFTTDYPALWGDYLNSSGLQWNLYGNIVTVNYTNSTRMRIIRSSLV